MRGSCHRIALIKDYQLDALAHELLGRAETLDLVPDHVDASIVRSVQLEGHMLVGSGPVELLGDSNHARGLTRAWGSMEQQVRQVLVVNKFAHCLNDLYVRDDLLQIVWSIFLHEGEALSCLGLGCRVDLVYFHLASIIFY